ncbi:hypothetical protein GQ55_2G116700 [Panicum hallii var. hallii]|uniref:Uncharacterized protein n=1 Tax=Panicum hallii var. hallii TaxID=1504633 RepID=A0A2T7ENY9_9POAL|nr:hypothetical protein GQ55_2G116700 [Panicum hallii var. hallii]
MVLPLDNPSRSIIPHHRSAKTRRPLTPARPTSTRQNHAGHPLSARLTLSPPPPLPPAAVEIRRLRVPAELRRSPSSLAWSNPATASSRLRPSPVSLAALRDAPYDRELGRWFGGGAE